MKKVILLITFSPKYAEYENKPRPRYCWQLPRGKWVGIWGMDFGDLMLKALVDHYPDYDCEVWQPDLRADRVYAAKLQERLVHKNFPARIRKVCKRCKLSRETYSKEMLREAKRQSTSGTVFLLPVMSKTKWFRKFKNNIKTSYVLRVHGLSSSLLLGNFSRSRNILKTVNRWRLSREHAAIMREVQHLLITNDDPQAISLVEEKYPWINLFHFVWGLDLDYWKPICSKWEARENLGIEQEDFVILLSQRLVPAYQVDKFLQALSAISAPRKFMCYITGHGLREYEQYLVELNVSLHLQDRVVFTGYVSGEDLRSYLIAADIFVTVPRMCAGSGGAIKSMALGTPVLHVTSGSSYVFLKENNAGVFVDAEDYKGWVGVLEEIMNGRNVNVVPRSVVEAHYSWENTARQVDNAIRSLSK
jgi:glycosyltransferase involved in cell wall biosynthesis